jgi:hypothetical protein
MNGEQGEVMTCLKVLSRNSHEETEKDHENMTIHIYINYLFVFL